jgi:DNA processing protein
VEAERLLLRLALARASTLRPRERCLLDLRLDGPRGLTALGRGGAMQLLGRRLQAGSWEPARWVEEAGADLRSLAGGTIGCLCLGEPGYPPQLAEIDDPPLVLFCRGTLPSWDRPLVAVVGTRGPTGRGSTAAFLAGYELARLGLDVVSGLARGVDRLAHEGTLRAGGRAVAVLGNGIDRVFPASSARLGRALLAGGGCLLSEYPPGVPAWRHHFPARNRVVSGLVRAVIVIQAPERSGALITADHALEQGRDLYVHEAGTAGARSGGTRELAEGGARVIGSAREILREWGWPVPAEREAAAGPVPDLAGAMEAELEGRGGEFNGTFFDAAGRSADV